MSTTSPAGPDPAGGHPRPTGRGRGAPGHEPLCGIPAAAVWLPEGRETLDDAVAAGLLLPEEAERSGYESFPVAGPDTPGPVLAVHAARDALAAGTVAPEQVALLLHAWTEYQGHDLWSPAHFVASEVGAAGALPIGIQQLSNGAAAAIELAVGRLDAGPALVTTGDRFCLPGFDRYRSDRGIVHTDGGTAVVLRAEARRDDALHLLGLASASAPEFESTHRGDDPFSSERYEQGRPVDLTRTKKAFFARHSRADFSAELGARAVRAVTDALDRAGVAPDDPSLRLLLLPRVGRLGSDIYAPQFAAFCTATVRDLGARTGHLGAGDAAANLAALADLLAPGERGVVFNGGSGYTFTGIVVEKPS